MQSCEQLQGFGLHRMLRSCCHNFVRVREGLQDGLGGSCPALAAVRPLSGQSVADEPHLAPCIACSVKSVV